MGIVDKILLLILVFLLPLSLVVTYKYFPTEDLSSKKQQELEGRVEGLIQQLTVAANEQKKETQTIKLSQAIYASDSGTLTVAGSAPTGNAAVLVSATVLPSNKPTTVKAGAKTTADNVKGSKVETVSIQPDKKGLFKYEYDVGRISDGVVELRFEQGTNVETVRFDMATKKQVSI